MVGCGLLMMAFAWGGSALMVAHRLERSRLMLWGIFLSFPLPFVAILTGWFTAEVGRQPWTIYGLLRTAQAVTPTLTTPQAVASLAIFVLIHGLIFTFGTLYIYRLLKVGPTGLPPAPANPKRPLAVPGASPAPTIELVQKGVQL
jgi:cytochrome d ubiquinol oxidase subunit I